MRGSGVLAGSAVTSQGLWTLRSACAVCEVAWSGRVGERTRSPVQPTVLSPPAAAVAGVARPRPVAAGWHCSNPVAAMPPCCTLARPRLRSPAGTRARPPLLLRRDGGGRGGSGSDGLRGGGRVEVDERRRRAPSRRDGPERACAGGGRTRTDRRGGGVGHAAFAMGPVRSGSSDGQAGGAGWGGAARCPAPGATDRAFARCTRTSRRPTPITAAPSRTSHSIGHLRSHTFIGGT